MKRELQRLTPKEVANQKVPGYYPDGSGLYLQVSESGSKSWLFRFVLNGRERQMGLGPFHTVGLADARAAAIECRKLLLAKVDPIEARNAKQAGEALNAAKSISFNECATAYIKAHKPGWSNAKHADQWTNTIETYCGNVFGKLSVQGIDTGLVLKALEPIWTTKIETATRLRGRIESVIDWATARGYRTGDNPARWRGHLENLLPTISKRVRVKHHPALPYSKVNDFITTLHSQDGVAAMALEFMILTAMRTKEVIGAKPEEFDLDAGVWTCPAERMKLKLWHNVPLSPRAIAIIREIGKTHKGEYVFPGGKEGKPLSNMAMGEVIRRMNENCGEVHQWVDIHGKDAVPHGFRSTFRDWAADCTNSRDSIAEMALAHVVTGVEGDYRRGDLFEKRRRLMLAWAKYCETPKSKGKVIEMKRSSKH